MKCYDLIVIGSGSGLNIISRILEEKVEMKIALIEKKNLGGTCLNVGCIPSKMLIEQAYNLKSIDKYEYIKNKNLKVNFSKLIKDVKNFVNKESNEIYKFYKNSKKVDFYHANAVFIDTNTIKVDQEIIKAKKIVLAIGAEPIIPNIVGLKKYWTYKEALFPKKKPKRLLIIGGGYIGVELGFFYSQMGSEVTILEKEKILSNLDIDIRHEFLKIYKKQVLCREHVKIIKIENKKNKHTVFYKKDKIIHTIEVDALLIATGIKAQTDSINLNKAKIRLDKKGFIKVNKSLQTTNEHIFALGDCIDSYFFKHTANFESDYIFEKLFDNLKSPIKYPSVPFAVFSYPEIAGVGKNEKILNKSKTSFFIKKVFFKELFKANIKNENIGFLKMIFSKKNETLLGAFIVGHNASELIHILSEFLNSKLTLDEIKKRIFIHPTLTEIILKASWD